MTQGFFFIYRYIMLREKHQLNEWHFIKLQKIKNVDNFLEKTT